MWFLCRYQEFFQLMTKYHKTINAHNNHRSWNFAEMCGHLIRGLVLCTFYQLENGRSRHVRYINKSKTKQSFTQHFQICFIFYIGQTVFHNQHLVILCKCCSVKTCLYWEWCSGYLLRSPFFLLWSFYNSSLTILPVRQVESVSVSLLYPVQSMNPINFTPYRIKFLNIELNY